MDPVAYQVYQNRLRETQRSSESLRVDQKKELKEKSRRPGELEGAPGASDQHVMSDDLMSESDCADFLGGGSGQAYERQHWEEPTERPERERHDEGDEDGDSHHSNGDGEPRHQEAPVQEAPGENGGSLEKVQSEDPGSAEAAPTGLAPAVAPNAAVTRSKAAGVPAAPTGANSALGGTAPRPAVPPSSGSPAERPPGPSKGAKGITGLLTPIEIKLDRALLPGMKSGLWGSMLDLSGGFLIGEDTGEVGPEVAVEEEKEEPGEPIPPGLADLLSSLVIGDTLCPAGRKLMGLLGRFGEGVLSACLQARVKVCLLPSGETVCSHPLLSNNDLAGAVDAVYLTDARSVVIEEACLLAPPVGFQPALFYFAHAWDHALGGEKFASLSSPAVQAGFQASAAGSHRFADSLVSSSPMCYFAQAVEAYLSLEPCADSIWTREDLYDFDRSIYSYIEYLFKRANRI